MGDYIVFGMFSGVGYVKKSGLCWLCSGEIVDIEIEGIGICFSFIVVEEFMIKIEVVE